ncbi:MAG TPA: calcium-binding protein [Patescibacteria group bacterium]|nr:calcium-binding protein [Patescibacteria group bacterium]
MAIINGDANNNTLLGTTANDSINGGAGNDWINTGGGRDTVYGGTGNDTIMAFSGSGNLLYGGDGDDFIRGMGSLDGGSGNDLLMTYNGDATLQGGVGNDTYVSGMSYYNTVILNDKGAGSSDKDTLSLSDYGINLADVRLSRSGDNLVITHIARNKSVIVTNWFLGAQYQVDNVVFGGGVTYSAADITSRVGQLYTGTAAADSLTGALSNDTMNGGAGNDWLSAGAGADILNGDAGNDSLDGGAGDDYLDGGAGVDSIWGGAGNDTTVYDSSDLVVSGGAGTDVLTAASLTSGLINWDLSKYSDIESFVGTAYNDTITGSSLNEIISGGTGTDLLSGGAGDDFLLGGTNNDTLVGGLGNDNLTGGTGSDVYKFTDLWGKDVISFDTDNANDTILFGNGISKQSLSAAYSGNNLVLSAGGYGSVTIENWNTAKLNNIQFADGTTATVDSYVNTLKTASAIINTDHALIVGIGKYSGVKKDLAGVAYDVTDVKTFVNTDSVWKSGNTATSVIQDAQATKANVMTSLSNLASQVSAGDDVLLYYSGHSNTGLVAVDGNKITPTELYQAVSAIGAKVGVTGHVSTFIDGCYSGSFVNYFKAQNAGSQYTIMSSSSASETSYDIGTNGVFTSALMDEALNGKLADLNKDSYITTQELYTYMTKTTTMSGLSSYMHPQIYDGSGGSYIIG